MNFDTITRLRRGMTFMFLLLAASGMLRAQSTGTSGVVVGVVTDSSGAAVVGATVSLKPNAGGAAINSKSNASGQYVLPLVTPGSYALTVSSKGFQTSVVNGVIVQVAKSTLVNVTLQPGAVSQTVIVNSTAQSQLQTTDAAVGTVIGTEEVENLPTVTRRAIELDFLQVGAQPWVNGGAYNGASGTVAGVTGDQNDFTLDGLDVSDPQVGGECCGDIGTGIPIPVEAVEEFNSSTTNQNASFGRSPGGAYSFAVRSGTRDLHGALYWYHVDTHLVANTWVANSLQEPKPEFLDNRIGFRVGGPLLGPFKRDKLNFFLNMEIRRFPNKTEEYGLVPTPSLRQGILKFADATGNVVSYNLANSTLCGTGTTLCDPRGIGISPVITQQYALLPAGNDTALGDQLNTTGIAGPANSAQNNDDIVGRLDWAISSKWHANGLWSWAENIIWNPSDTPGVDWEGGPNHIITTATQDNYPHLYAGQITGELSPTLVNQLGFGATTSTLQFGMTHPTTLIPAAGVALDLPVIQDPIQIYGARAQLGVSRTWQVTDGLTKTRGKHEFQLGAHYERLFFSETRQGASNYNVYPIAEIGTGQFVGVSGAERPPACGGSINTDCLPAAQEGLWNSLYMATLGIVDSVNEVTVRNPQGVAAPFGTDMVSAGTWNHLEYHLGDTWRVTNGLTLNMGLMGMVETPFSDDQGRQSFIVSEQTGQPIDPVQYLNQKADMARVGQVYNPGFAWAPFDEFNGRGEFPTQNHIGPRVGAAWSPSFSHGVLGGIFGNRKGVIRGGFGMAYYRVLAVGEVQFAEEDDQLLAQTNSLPAPLNSSGQNWRVGVDGPAPLPNVLSQVEVPYVPPSNYGAGYIIAFDPNYRQAYEDSADFTYQREIPGNMLAEVGYIGRFGRHLETDLDMNAVPYFIADMTHKSTQNFAQAFDQVSNQLRSGVAPANITPQPWFENNTGSGSTVNLATVAGSYFTQQYVQQLWELYINSMLPTSVQNEQVLATLDISPVGWSNYNGGFVSLNKRYSRGLTLTVNYTFSHWLTTLEDSTDSGSSTPPNPYNLRFGYGDAYGDRRGVLNTYGLYNLPFGDGHLLSGGALHHLLNNWSTSDIITYSTGLPLFMGISGQPFGALSGNESLPTIGPRNFKSGVHKGVSGSDGVGTCCGPSYNIFQDPAAVYNDFRPFQISTDTTNSIGAMRGIPMFTWDMNVSKTTSLFEKTKMKLGCDFFNVSNHPLFNNPGTDYLNPQDFGVISSQPGDPGDGDYWTPRRLQLSLRVEF